MCPQHPSPEPGAAHTPHAPCSCAPTLPAETRSPAGSAGREGEGADLQHWHLAAPPAAAAGSPRDWAQHSSGHSTAQDGSGRAGRGPGHPQRAGSEPGRRQSWENSGSMTGSRGEGGKGERWESTWLRSALPGSAGCAGQESPSLAAAAVWGTVGCATLLPAQGLHLGHSMGPGPCVPSRGGRWARPRCVGTRRPLGMAAALASSRAPGDRAKEGVEVSRARRRPLRRRQHDVGAQILFSTG